MAECGLSHLHYDREVASVSSPGSCSSGFSLEFIEVKRITVSSDFLFPPHLHKFCEIFVPEEGPYRCFVGEIEHSVLPGGILFVQPGDWHSDRFIAGSRFLILSFILHGMDGGAAGLLSPDAPRELRRISLTQPSRLSSTLEAIRCSDVLKQEDILSLEPLCQAFFWELAASIPSEFLSLPLKQIKTGDKFKNKLFDVFAKTMVKDFSPAALAAELGVSRRSLENKAKDLLGSSPEKAFMAWKAGEAAKLLASGLSVKETAAMLGFANQFHFSRVFKRFSGHPPSAT